MLPTLEPGDFLVAVRVRSDSLRRGALVGVEHPSRSGFEMVKRLEGIPGQQLGDGRVLGLGQYWVVGDAAGASTDSRTFGPVHATALRGVVRVRYWPPARATVWVD
jgi:hypothetical protein